MGKVVIGLSMSNDARLVRGEMQERDEVGAALQARIQGLMDELVSADAETGLQGARGVGCRDVHA